MSETKADECINRYEDIIMDSELKVIVEVTSECIAKGKKGVPTLCPVAIAINQKLPGIKASVKPQFITIRDAAQHYLGDVSTPQVVREWIRQYDSDALSVQPFRFEIGKLKGETA